MNPKQFIRQQIAKWYQRSYEKKRAQYTLSYTAWLQEREQDFTAAPVPEEKADIVLLCFGEGAYGAGAKERFEKYFRQHPEVLLAYGDEDIREADGTCHSPWLKPDWSPDSYLCRDYLGEAVAVCRRIYEQLTDRQRREAGACHDRLVELAGGYEPGCRQIGHLQEVVFHRKHPWELPGEGRAGQRQAPEPLPADGSLQLVSIIIPSKDNVEVLFRCLETVRKTVRQIPCEILLVDNGSSPENKAAIQARVNTMNQDLTGSGAVGSEPESFEPASADPAGMWRGIRYLYQPMEFNFSAMCNMGAAQAEGDLLLFLNDDIEAVEPGWLEAMAQKAQQPWTGAVGMKLLYPDGKRIQHAGVVDIPIGPVHKLQYLEDDGCYYDGRNRGSWNVLAVTGACLMLRTEVFEEAGGFAEELPVAFNDIDLCFKVYELGYHNVVINNRHLLHHESLSRGNDDSEEKQRRLVGERNLLYRRHPDRRGEDPYYHPWLNNRRLDTRIRPAFEEGRSSLQRVRPGRLSPDAGMLQGAREDACLRLTIEYAGTGWIQGYLVVLGSDNALFERRLLFQSKEHPEELYQMECGEQYRLDLEENMPDQRNVGLCGFCCEFQTCLPKGEYRIGAWARDRISGLQLKYWSHCTLLSDAVQQD